MAVAPKTTWQMIQIPTLITLAITVLRLIGELQHWSPRFFNTSAGGGGAVVGIVWLVPIFGVYFALQLIQQEGPPANKGKAIGLQLLGIVVLVGGGFLALKGWEYLGYIVILISWIIFGMAWGGLTRTLLAYGFAARIPVVIIMFIAMSKNWVSHYNAFPPAELFPYTMFGAKFWHGALLPQLIVWVTFTMAVGGLFGILTTFFSRKSSPAGQAV